ncbi:nucleotide-diphospho-sugar transferase [Lipomyces arxii]|uniref:nucleotide-diphospho-sugar transferase n=1 Tax=Lipomyces arxii TaxID=56418 RepID=UPI0034CD9A63
MPIASLYTNDLILLLAAPYQIGKEKASLVTLVRNRELQSALKSIRILKDRFNNRYRYPWTFLNDEPFTEEFINYTSGMASVKVQYGLIDKAQWKMADSIRAIEQQKIIYGGSLSYRHMCRYNSGYFYRHELLSNYDWYFSDPFEYIRQNNKVYGFVMSMYEFASTIETLWGSTKSFIHNNPQCLAGNNSLDSFVNGAEPSKGIDTEIFGEYNLCHFWTNFEIANLNFWRSKAYTDNFTYLDSLGLTTVWRWGDAPIHSLAAGLFLFKDQNHHFSDVGYRHSPYTRCPQDEQSRMSRRCFCPREKHFDDNGYSCLPRWWKVAGQSYGAGPGLKSS